MTVLVYRRLDWKPHFWQTGGGASIITATVTILVIPTPGLEKILEVL